jgi:hypothetical protein
MATIELAAYIDGLRAELEKSIEESEGKALRFGTDKIDLEVEVGVETELGANGEVKFRFLVFDATLGGDGKRTVTNTQTIKLGLTPVYKGKTGPVMVGGTTSNRPL